MFPAASPEPSDIIASSPPRLTVIDKTAEALVVLAYMAVQVALFWSHTPWRDEAQAWLVAESLRTPIDFFLIPGEGHPPLWFWLLRGLSAVASFDQARGLTLGVAILNALLFWRLLHGKLLLLVVMLASQVTLSSWGFHFRPYSIVLTLALATLLLDRGGKGKAATWCLAIACGFHFFAGFLFGFWLLVQWHRGTQIAKLIAPAALAMVFGASAVLSGIGNQGTISEVGNLVTETLNNLAWFMPSWQYRSSLAGIAYVALLAFALYNKPFILGSLLSLTILFAAGTAAVYGEFSWHTAFMMILAFMAFMLAGNNGRQWVLVLILAPQAVLGIAQARNTLAQPADGDIEIYRIIQTDAGKTIIPPQQLVAWPDHLLSPAAAIENITYRSGNSGTLMGPVDWRTRIGDRVDPGMSTLPTPYWLVCMACQSVLDELTANGLRPTALGSALNFSDGRIYAYRIDG